MSPRALSVVIHEVVRRNRVRDGLVYLQVTRGVARRDHAFPAHDESALVVTARTTKPFDREAAGAGVAVITVPETRWARCDIKSISLLPNVLGKQAAREADAYEAWMVKPDGTVTEGTSSNAWIVTADGELVTRAADHAILNGITRQALIRLAAEDGVQVVERSFTVDEALAAREAFLTSTSSFVKPVVRIDDRPVGNGHIGSLTAKLLDFYAAYMERADDGS
jgi:D-alanine transaminase